MRTLRAFAALAIAFSMALSGSAWGTPPRNHDHNFTRLSQGVAYWQIRNYIVTSAYVVSISPGAQVRPLVALSNNQVAENPARTRLQTTSRACQQSDCVAAVNGDYFCTGSYCPRDRYQPEGGVIARGHMLRSPYSVGWREQQLMLNRQGCPLKPARLKWQAVLRSGYAAHAINGINVDRRGQQLVLYTTAYGNRSHSRGGVDLVARLAKPRWDGKIGRSVRARPIRLVRGGDANIQTGTVVLSGRDKSARLLRTLWRRHKWLSLRITTRQPVWNSIGAKPLLLLHGHYTGQWRHKPANPITIFAWKPNCTRFLITVDGREGDNQGATNPQAARLAKSLGATTAFGLDGGGSTTLVTSGGRVMNQPSDRRGRRQHVERRVADSLLFIGTNGTRRYAAGGHHHASRPWGRGKARTAALSPPARAAKPTPRPAVAIAAKPADKPSHRARHHKHHRRELKTKKAKSKSLADQQSNRPARPILALGLAGLLVLLNAAFWLRRFAA